MRVFFLPMVLLIMGCDDSHQSQPNTSITVASFNVSMEARNYVSGDNPEQLALGNQILMDHLATGEHPQIRNIAEIIQRTDPDIILLNEFDYIDSPQQGIQAFIRNYLNQPQHGSKAIDYPYVFYGPSNTGLPSTFDLDNNGVSERFGADALGFGLYPGHYAMVLLSKYPIVNADIRTFQRFLWSDMPDALKPVNPEDNTPFYTEREWHNLRLSSKSHWDIPVNVDGKVIRILASHPTPPVFDGPEDRNGRRNHDEIRFWLDYITPDKAAYIYDDRGVYGGIDPEASFVIVGDLNASPDRENETKSVITELLASEQVNNRFVPSSEAGKANRTDNDYAQYHTATWAARVDYVIPSTSLQVSDGGVFWPSVDDPLYRLVKDRASSSDHRLVWLTLSLAASER
jgi:endonuclease/exonuclease/phosphatase family metal-dependent hydrolase